MRPRFRAAARRVSSRRASEGDRWERYLVGVEPALAAVPRVHRFAQPPQLGSPETAAAGVAVWIEGAADGADAEDRLARSRGALEAGSVAPEFVTGASLAEALANTRREHVMLVRAGDEPAPLALERLGQAVTLAPDAGVITCDEDQLGDGHRRESPHFRPGPAPDRWLACDDSGSLLVVRRDRAAALVGELIGGPGWRHQLALGLAGPASLEHAHVPLLLCHCDTTATESSALPNEGLERLLARWDPGARVSSAGRVRRIRRQITGEPSVEVIVCLRDKPELLARAAGSLLERTSYERLTLALVDNGSREPATLELLSRLHRDHRVRILRDERPFNFAGLNNAAAASSQADVLVFLNNDTEVVHGDWIEPLLEEALRPGVGAVAPLLLYPDGGVQHAGAALGLHGYAGHPFAGLAPDAPTPFGVAQGGTRNWLAVTAACMMVQRAKFAEVGAFDESFVVAGNDVDLCLRLTAAGYRSLCVTASVLTHDESRSRGTHIDAGDFVRSEQSYGEFRTVGDPFYNPNLTLDRTDCGVRTPGEGGA